MTHVVTSRLVPLAKSKARCGSVCCSTVRIRPEEFGVESTEKSLRCEYRASGATQPLEGEGDQGSGDRDSEYFSFLLRNLRLDDAAKFLQLRARDGSNFNQDREGNLLRLSSALQSSRGKSNAPDV
jgi:hypothetical protein